MRERFLNANTISCKKTSELFTKKYIPTIATSTFVGLINSGYAATYELCPHNNQVLNQLIGAAVVGAGVSVLAMSTMVYTGNMIKELTCPSAIPQLNR